MTKAGLATHANFGKTSLNFIKQISVAAYGQAKFPLQQLARVEVETNRKKKAIDGVVIRPHDPATLPEIQCSLTEQNILGLKVKVLGEGARQVLVLGYSHANGSSPPHRNGARTREQLSEMTNKYRLDKGVHSATEFGGRTTIKGAERVASRRAMRRLSVDELSDEIEQFGKSWWN